MFRCCLLLMLALCANSSAVAQELTHSLFAIDLSLGAKDKQAAFDIVRESTLVAPESRLLGLTLFDDTLRAYVAPSSLDAQHIKALNQALAKAPESVRATSNLAVGIERAIDALNPAGRADLIVFSRGAIDTATDDPRARFNEWLDKVLLPQAAQNNISISLVVPQDLDIDPILEQSFANTAPHRLVSFNSADELVPELTSMLNIPKRVYGVPDLQPEPDTQALETAQQEPTDEQVDAENTQSLFAGKSREFPIGRMLLLLIACSLLVVLMIWRYRVTRASPELNDNSMGSGTYRPLTEKPSKTMESWVEEQSGVTSDKPRSGEIRSDQIASAPALARSFATPAPDSNAPVASRSENPADPNATVVRPSDDTVVRPLDDTVIRPSDTKDS